jgi:hypothetical protein
LWPVVAQTKLCLLGGISSALIAALNRKLWKRASCARTILHAYRRRRIAATLRGEGFMPFKTAELRLRRALIPLLVGGNNIHVQSLFETIFDR